MSVPSFRELCMHMIWPVSCPVCGTVGKMLCDSCLRSLLRPPLPRCLWCGRVIPCRIHGGDAKIRAGALYEGAVRELILMLKHGRYEALGPQLGRALAEVWERPEIDVLLPVPLHRKSKRRYNQAEAIARGLSEAWGIPVRNAAEWAQDTSTRAGLSRAERLDLSREAFECDASLSGLRAGLVDDVCTTGTTLSRLGSSCRGKGIEVAGAFVVACTPE